MPTNNFKAWAVAGGANVQAQATYIASASLATGYALNQIPPSDNFNKALRQATLVAAAMAQSVVTDEGVDCLDDGSVTDILALIKGSLGWLGGAHIWQMSTTAFQLGVTGTLSGQLNIAGSASGLISIKPQAAAGTYNFNLPITAGTSGAPLLSGGGGAAAMTWGTVTGSGNFVLSASPTLTGTVIGAAATWSGIVTAPEFDLTGSGSGTIAIKPQAAAGTYNFNLPITAGASGAPLLSAAGGSAAMTWGSLTGTGNFVLSASPTFTGTVLGAASTWSALVTASLGIRVGATQVINWASGAEIGDETGDTIITRAPLLVIANAGVYAFSTVLSGLFMIGTSTTGALYVGEGGGTGPIVLVSSQTAAVNDYTNAKGTAGKTNVYLEGGVYKIQNNTGGSLTYSVNWVLRTN